MVIFDDVSRDWGNDDERRRETETVGFPWLLKTSLPLDPLVLLLLAPISLFYAVPFVVVDIGGICVNFDRSKRTIEVNFRKPDVADLRTKRATMKLEKYR